MNIVDIKELIQSVESRITPSEGVNILIEMQLSKLARKDCYQMLAPKNDDSYIERDKHEIIKSELRLFNMIVLEYLLECSYQEGATADEIIEVLHQVIQEVGNPWGFTPEQVETLGRDLLRNVLQNEGHFYRHISNPLTQPKQANTGIELVTKENRRQGRKEEVVYKLKDQAFQYLYRKKEIESYLHADLNFTVMALYEAVKKGNFEGALRGVKELEGVLINFTYRKIPEFIQRMNQEFDQIHEEKRLLSEDAHENLKLTLQKVREIRDLIGDKRQLIGIMGLNGEASVANEKYRENREKIKELQSRINELLKHFSAAFSEIQRLNREYDYLIEHYEVKTSYEYIDYKQDLLPFLMGHTLHEQASILRGLVSLFEIPSGPKMYTLDRLLSSKRVRKARVKEDSNIMDEELDPEFQKEKEKEEALKKELDRRRIELIKSFFIFAINHPNGTLKDYLEDLKTTDLERYLSLLAAEGDDLFYRTVLYSVYRKAIYIPRDSSPKEQEKTGDMTTSLVDALCQDPVFAPLKGFQLETNLVEDENQEMELIHQGFPNFQFEIVLNES